MQIITIPRLLHHIDQVPIHIRRFSEQTLTHKPLPNKWSKKEVLGHLIDSAMYNLPRFTQAPLVTSPYVFQSYPQDELVIINDYQHQSIDHLLHIWTGLNRQILHVIKALDGDTLTTPVQLATSEHQQTLGWLIHDYLRHMEHHLAQIFGTSSTYPEQETPPMLHSTITNALAELAQSDKPFANIYTHGSLLVEIYQPEKVDLQKPHIRDELYIVISGEGTFVNGDKRQHFHAGDVLFVPAGVEHRFENFTEGFKNLGYFLWARRWRNGAVPVMSSLD